MLRVLVIEDEAMIRRLIRQSLEQSGYHVDEAANGRVGLKALHAAAYDLVITDIVMPEVDGLEVLSTIGRLWPATPVLATSGGGRLGDPDILQAARDLGAAATLLKPFTLRVLRAAIDLARDNHRAAAGNAKPAMAWAGDT